ncbi:MAG: hypothetical protein KC900_12470 [Candidatus Omnitrophica bacterium]|nr:hypothetical protein [Candidatus Omnitrophota bacterium]
METLEAHASESTHYIDDTLRAEIIALSKDFKRSWISLGRHLYAVWQDKLYRNWGFEKFENYIEGEVGLKKNLATKLLRSYLFLEQDEPQYLDAEFTNERDAMKVPGYEEINFLRLAKHKKEVKRDDYARMKKDVFEKGKNATVMRKDLTALMKERKYVDPDQEREDRHQTAIRRVVHSLKNFQKDMEALQLIPAAIMDDTKKLLDRLEAELD